MKMTKNIDDTVIYQTKNGAITLKQDVSSDMLWASQAHIADIFEIERSVATKHIRNILKDKELNENSVCAKLARTAEDGKTYQVQFYSLDVILAVGYRTNSKKAIAFRQWATETLKDHIYKGYTINKNRIQKNYDDFLKAIDDVKALLPADTTIDHDSILELVTLFADTWFSLDAYDKDKLTTEGATKKKVILTAEKLNNALAELKQNLITKGEATDIFGVERGKDSIAGIIGNVMQSFDGEELYPSIEEKAASKRAIAWIIRNRMAKKRWGDSYQKIVVRPSQFNCWNRKDPNYARLQRPGQDNPADKISWEESIKIIKEVHDAPETDNPIPGVCNYFSGKPDPKHNKWEGKNPFVLPDVPKFHFVKLD